MYVFQDEKYHTELVLHYVDEAVRLTKEKASPELLQESRDKLQDLLTSSSHYQPQLVLKRLQGTSLHIETAAVFGRVSQLCHVYVRPPTNFFSYRDCHSIWKSKSDLSCLR